LLKTQLKLKADQKKKAQDFIGVTGCSDAHAIVVLKRYDWNVEAAIGAYFENPALQEKKAAKVDKVDKKAIERFFDTYKGAGIAAFPQSRRRRCHSSQWLGALLQ
jgi:hypothetical protein